MNIQVNVINQKLRIATNLKSLVSGSQEFIRFEFLLSEEWNELTVFAQFRQGDVAYNRYLDAENCVYLPPDIEPGNCMLILYGTKESVIATTNYVNLVIDENMLIEDAESVNISTSLYNQLVDIVKDLQENGVGAGSDGKDGVGIESIHTVTSDEDGGENILTIKLTDGTQTEFVVKNGSKGSGSDAAVTSVSLNATDDGLGNVTIAIISN